MDRFLSVDILRGVAIVLMVLVHFTDNLSPREESSAGLYDAMTWLGSLPAPLFTFVSGVSFSLWARKQRAGGTRDRAVTRIALRRGLFLFAIGIAFNLFVWLPEDALNWDILTLLGAALIFLAFARRIPLPALTLMAVIIVMLSPPLRVVGDLAAYWENDVYVYDFNARDAISGFLVNGYFPLFPWLLFPLAGFLIGEVYFARRRLVPRWTLPALGVGLLALAIALVMWGNRLPALFAGYYANGYTEFPASTEYVFFMLGACLLSLDVLHGICDRSDFRYAESFMSRHLRRFSAFSLTVYFVHHIAHLTPLWLYGAWMGHEDSTHYWRNAMSTPTAVGLAVVFLILCDFGLRFLERRKKFSLESLMRWVCG